MSFSSNKDNCNILRSLCYFSGTGHFKITGKILTQCSLKDPITGDLTVETSAVPIESIDIQLRRVESILVGEKIITDTSVIQTTQVLSATMLWNVYGNFWLLRMKTSAVCQIADGDICRLVTLPIYVLIPRLLVCPSLSAGYDFFQLFLLPYVWMLHLFIQIHLILLYIKITNVHVFSQLLYHFQKCDLSFTCLFYFLNNDWKIKYIKCSHRNIFNTMCRSFSIEFQVSIIISFQSQLSKLYPKSDLRTPMPWVSV